MFAKVWKVVLKDLLEKLKGFLDLTFIEAIEGHNWVLSDHIAEGDEG